MTPGDARLQLGIRDGASVADIRAAYRVRSQLLHPDHHAGASAAVLAEAHSMMVRLSDAYQVALSTAGASDGHGKSGAGRGQAESTSRAGWTSDADTEPVSVEEALDQLIGDLVTFGPELGGALSGEQVSILSRGAGAVRPRRLGKLIVDLERIVTSVAAHLGRVEGIGTTAGGLRLPTSWLAPYQALETLDDPPVMLILVDTLLDQSAFEA